MGDHYGDFDPGQLVRASVNTATAGGTPITLAGAPAARVYKDGGTTETASGVALTVDLDGRTGLHEVTVATDADGTFYAAGSDFKIVLTAGTVNGVSVAGVVIGTFSVRNRGAVSGVVGVAYPANFSAMAISAEGRVDVCKIDGKKTDGSPAVANRPAVYLNKLDLTNDAGTALSIVSEDSIGMWVQGFGNGLRLTSTGGGQADVGLYIDSAGAAVYAQGDVADVYLANGLVNWGVTVASPFTAADAGRITGIEAKTDSLTFTNAGKVDATAITVSDKTGYSLTATPPTAGAIADAVWDEDMSAHTTTGTAGKWLADLFGLVAKFSGVTSLANWLRLLGRKDTADGTAKTEYNTGGGTYDETTDSSQAIRDRGDAAWVGGGSGVSAADIANALASRDVTIVGIVAGQVIRIVKGDDYSTDAQRRWTFLKAEGPPNEPWPDDLTGHDIEFTATKTDANLNPGDSTITLTGVITQATGDSQSVYVAPTASDTDGLAAGEGRKGYEWKLTATTVGNVKTLRTGLMSVLP